MSRCWRPMQFLPMLTLPYLLVLALASGVSGRCVFGDDVIQMTSWSGTITSPGQPRGMYPSDQLCKWEVKVSEGSRVSLTFETFQLEEGHFVNSPPEGANNKICNDVVKITDGVSVLFSGCGVDGAGQTFTSSGHVMTVTFSSDESTEYAGFTASYQGVCGGNVTANATLESPGFPNVPPGDVSCEWRVTSDMGAIIYIHPAGDSTDSLHDCSQSSLLWKTENEAFGEKKKEKRLCRNDSAIVTRSDVILTYDPHPSRKTWTGVLDVVFTTNSDCHQFCRNTDDCLKPKKLDVGDYRCVCPTNYTGANCEVYADPCVSLHCQHGRCVSDEAGHRCECQPQYTGSACETRVDPCAGLTCANGGRCVREGDTSARCQCVPGFEPPDCQQESNPCRSQPCQNGGTCTLREHGDFVCTCPPTHTGILCTITAGAAHCMSETDDTIGSQLSWRDTLAGHQDNQSCPSGITGQAHRNCMLDDQSPTGGVWRRPDLSDCVSPVVLELARDARALRETGFEEDYLFNISRRLLNVTSSIRFQGTLMTSLHDRSTAMAPQEAIRVTSSLTGVRPLASTVTMEARVTARDLEVTSQESAVTLRESGESSVPLYPGDLLLASDVLKDISVGVINARTLGQQAHAQLSREFTQSLDNLVSPSTLHVWQNARVRLVESKVASLLESAEQFSSNLVRRQSDSTDRQLHSTPSVTMLFQTVGSYVDLLVLEWTDSSNNGLRPVFGPHSSSRHSTILLPPQLLQIARAGSSKLSVRLYTGRFTSLSRLLSLKEYRYTRINEVNTTKIVNSDVISAEILGLPKSAFSQLTEPVEITFRLTDPGQRPDLEKFCVFMNMTASDAAGRWLQDGCYLGSTNSSHVTCLCYHLTNFAVLLDVFNNAAELDEDNEAALSYLSYIGGSLSVLAAIVVIVVFQYFRLSSDRVRIHEQLAVAIILVQLLFLIGIGRTAARTHTPQWVCKTVAILLHYSLTALFCWMLVEGLHIYVLLVKVFKRGSHLKKYCAVGWGVPFIVVGISVGVFYDKYGDGHLCWLNHELLLVCFVPTISLVIIINTVILVLVLRVMLRSLHSTSKANAQPQSSLRMSLKASAVLLPLLGLTWTLGFLAVDVDGSKVMTYIFTYLFTITNSFQGVMFFVFHCLLNADVHGAYERRYRRRKRPVSMETTTRKSSDMSTYLTDGTPTGKSTTKTNLSDVSALHRRTSLGHGRFLLFDGHPASPFDPIYPTFDHHHQHFDPDRGVTFDTSTAAFDDLQTSDTDRIWRRYSLSHDASDDFPLYSALQRSASSPVTDAQHVGISNGHIDNITSRPASTSSNNHNMAAFLNNSHKMIVVPDNSVVLLDDVFSPELSVARTASQPDTVSTGATPSLYIPDADTTSAHTRSDGADRASTNTPTVANAPSLDVAIFQNTPSSDVAVFQNTTSSDVATFLRTADSSVQNPGQDDSTKTSVHFT